MAMMDDDNETSDLGGEIGGLSQDDLDALLAQAQEGTPEEAWADVTEADLADGAANLDPSIMEAVAAAAGIADPDPAPPMAGGGMSPTIDLQSFGDSSGSSDFRGGMSEELDRVRDIPLEMTVELGRTRLLIRDILNLSTGSIIELDKIAGEPVDLFANGLLVARGEVVVIDDNFGVRVTEIITAEKRKQGSQSEERDAIAA